MLDFHWVSLNMINNIIIIPDINVVMYIFVIHTWRASSQEENREFMSELEITSCEITLMPNVLSNMPPISLDILIHTKHSRCRFRRHRRHQ